MTSSRPSGDISMPSSFATLNNDPANITPAHTELLGQSYKVIGFHGCDANDAATIVPKKFSLGPQAGW
jgi:hypothetical protein